MRSNSIVAASIVAMGLAFAVSVPMNVVHAADVTEAQIAAARTPADHEAIAAAYDADAKAADARAAEHEAMAKTYAANLGQKAGTQAMVKHCKRLADDYRAAAKDYRDLAAEHRAMAKTSAQ